MENGNLAKGLSPLPPKICEVDDLLIRQSEIIDVLENNLTSLMYSIDEHNNKIGRYLKSSQPDETEVKKDENDALILTEMGKIITEKNNRISILAKRVDEAKRRISDLSKRFEG